ncbi:hypothetical protein OLZ31_26450, partial [Enterobacter asburiae]|nr:hypothetical protein [Enterobacter asburiae]
TAAYSEYKRENSHWPSVAIYIAKTGADVGLVVKSLDGLLNVLVSDELFGLSGLAKSSSMLSTLAAEGYMRFLASWEFMLALFFIEQAMTIFLDNDLQKWCKNGVFGIESSKEIQSTEMIGIQEIRNKICNDQSDSFLKAVETVI